MTKGRSFMAARSVFSLPALRLPLCSPAKGLCARGAFAQRQRWGSGDTQPLRYRGRRGGNRLSQQFHVKLSAFPGLTWSHLQHKLCKEKGETVHEICFLPVSSLNTIPCYYHQIELSRLYSSSELFIVITQQKNPR